MVIIIALPDQHVDSSFAGRCRMNSLVSVFWLPDAAIAQGVSNVVRVRSEIFLVRRMGHGKLKHLKNNSSFFFVCVLRIHRANLNSLTS